MTSRSGGDLSLAEVAVHIVKGAGAVLEMWRRRLADLVEANPGFSEVQREDLREGLLFLSKAITILMLVSPQEYDPDAFVRYLEEELERDGSLLGPVLPPDDGPDPVRESLEPAWIFAVEACARDLGDWVRILQDVQDSSEPPPPDILERIDSAVRRHLRPALADLGGLVADPDEAADA